jgi:hypothetical protein
LEFDPGTFLSPGTQQTAASGSKEGRGLPSRKGIGKKDRNKGIKTIEGSEDPCKVKGCSAQGGFDRDPELLGSLYVRRCETELKKYEDRVNETALTIK